MTEHTKYLIAVPTLDMVPLPFVASLMYMRRVGASRCSFLANSLVFDARNMLAQEAIETGADRVLWLDSDMVFDLDLMQRLAADMDEGRDFVAGLFFKRRLPTMPCIYKQLDVADNESHTQVYADYPKDQLFEVAGSGFGAVMTSTKLLKDVADTFGKPFYPMLGLLGEDLSFCWRARQLGYRLYCDSRIKVGHVGFTAFDEGSYIRQGDKQNDTARL